MRATLCVLISSFCLMCLGCSSLTGIPLVWKPTSDTYGENSGTNTLSSGQRIKVMPFTDNRDNKAEIARNIESGNPKLVTTKDDVSKWCTDRFKEILQLHGFDLTETGETVQLRGEVVQFHVVEDTLYKGTVALKITVEAPDKTMLWQGLSTGKAKRFGRSYSQENYYETLSDAYLEAVRTLIKDDSFVKALRGIK